MPNMCGNQPCCPAIGASESGRTAARRTLRFHDAVFITARDMARMSGEPLRTAQDRLARWRREGAPVVRVPHGGRGQPPWGMRAEDYARRIGVDLEMLAAGAS